MQYNKFLASLGLRSGLFSFNKQNLDLLLMAQLNIITISQLHLTEIHGETPASARLSLNRLAKKGLVKKKSLPNHNNFYFFTLTSAGKEYLRRLLPEEYMQKLGINLEKRLPISGPQIMHRLLTNDFYCSFLSMPAVIPAVWKTEEPLAKKCDHSQTQPARADGFLSTKYADYYIEQDNQTQGEPVLQQKIAQYMGSGVFDVYKHKKILVFTLASPRAKLPNTKSNYTVYRMLLKICQTWEQLNTEQNLSLDYMQFYQLLSSASYKHGITEAELMTLEQLHYVYPELDDIATANTLKKHYMDDTGYLKAVGKEMDAQYNKRLKSSFCGFYRQNQRLVEHAITGNSIFAVPNHRLKQCQPFITSNEYALKDLLLRTLFYNNLNIDGWNYQEPYSITLQDRGVLYFARGFYHSFYGHIVFEFAGADLSVWPRLTHYKNHFSTVVRKIVIILIGADFLCPEIIGTYRALFTNSTNILFTKTLPGTASDQNVAFYDLHNPNQKIVIECDPFDNTLHLLRKEESNEQTKDSYTGQI